MQGELSQVCLSALQRGEVSPACIDQGLGAWRSWPELTASQWSAGPLWASLNPWPPSATLCESVICDWPPVWLPLPAPASPPTGSCPPTLTAACSVARAGGQGSTPPCSCFQMETAARLSSQVEPHPLKVPDAWALGLGLQTWHPQSWV